MPRTSKTTLETGPDGLDWALAPVRAWFCSTFVGPTLAQLGGWPSISRKQHTLICAPTGTGKTLAAFLACLDATWRVNGAAGTSVLYVSPLKALGRDIAVNLHAPLAGIVETADRMGDPLRSLSVGVRTGDTSPADRRAQAKRPPDILITTPESLHLLLTSKAREGLRGVSHVIVDEIHDLCSSKRGASLSLLLERLESMLPDRFVRIGLSATVNPTDEVARFLVGWQGEQPRPVTVVDAGVSKRIELGVSAAISGPERSRGPGPSLEDRLLGLIRSNRSTVVFANNRAEVERLTSRLNRRAALKTKDLEPVRSHHGSLSLEQRRETEEALKRGELRGVVATASLELGIDVGSIDHVCQVGSPGGVARGLQRVGRAGHSAGETSRASFFARGEGELLELAALAGAMRAGAVEPVRVPRNCLDVLSQQVVAIVSGGPIDAARLFSVVRRSDCFRSLRVEQFEGVVSMLSGRSDLIDVRDLRPRIRWDRLSNLLEPLPGTLRFALMGGNTIPDTGQIPVYLESGPRLGEFDEAFVMERRVGDAVLLGTSTWVIRSIDSRRVTVSPGAGRSAVLPFWRGEGPGRSGTLGQWVGRLRRTISERIDDPGLPAWLAEHHSVDPDSVPVLIESVARQIRAAGAVPDDRSVLVETFLDQAGIRNLALLTPMGSRFHLGLRLVLQGWIRDRLGMAVSGQQGDDGILIQLPGVDDPPVDLLERIDINQSERILIAELRDSALFALRFRQIASRALLSGGASPGGRAPLWFQRSRAEELLQVLEETADHPLIVETVRECLLDDLDWDGLLGFLRAIREGSIAVREVPEADSPSPYASMLSNSFSMRHADRFSRRSRGGSRSGSKGNGSGSSTLRGRFDPELPAALVDPDAVHRIESRLRGLARPPRSAEEMAELLRFCGDLTPVEVTEGMATLLGELETRGVSLRIRIVGVDGAGRWIAAEAEPLYRSAFVIEGEVESDPECSDEAIEHVVRGFLKSRALVGIEEVSARYGIDRRRARGILERFASSGEVVPVPGRSADDLERWGDRRNVEEVRRLSVALRRKEAVAVEPDVFADLLARHQHVHPADVLGGRDGLEAVLKQLRGFSSPFELWESELLPRRIRDFKPSRLDELLRTDSWRWRRVEVDSEAARLALLPNDFKVNWPEPEGLSLEASEVLEAIRAVGEAETGELVERSGLDPKAVGRALVELSSRGVIGGDHLDPIRASGVDPKVRQAATRSSRASGRRRGGSRSVSHPVGELSGVRWSAFSSIGEENGVMAWARAMLDRFGVLCRETAALEPWAPPWSVLRAALDASELRGEVRRGYFVSGLSGVQFALESFADRLARHRPAEESTDAVLLSTLDPVNLYGSGGAIELPTIGPGMPRMIRSVSNHVVMVRGRPVLFSEGYARRLTTMPWADDRELSAAAATLATLSGPSRRILEVKEVDRQPARKSRLADRLQECGFVRDLHGLAYYAGW